VCLFLHDVRKNDGSSHLPPDVKSENGVSIKQMLGIVIATPTKEVPTMPTPVEATTAIQEKVFASIQVSQKAFVDSIKSWADTVEAVSSTLPQVGFGDPKPSDVMETTLDFSKKVLASQREFATKMFEAVSPAFNAPATATSAAKSRA